MLGYCRKIRLLTTQPKLLNNTYEFQFIIIHANIYVLFLCVRNNDKHVVVEIIRYFKCFYTHGKLMKRGHSILMSNGVSYARSIEIDSLLNENID